jgi:hypothetical protein
MLRNPKLIIEKALTPPAVPPVKVGGHSASYGKERPGHKYKRRERDPKTQKWIYWYEDAQGKEYSSETKLHEKEPAKTKEQPKLTVPAKEKETPKVEPQEKVEKFVMPTKKDTHGKKSGEEAIKEYVKDFNSVTKNLVQDFHEFVSKDIEKIGDAIIKTKQATGYNYARYEVQQKGFNKTFLKDPLTISYSMYNSHPEHTAELLSKVRDEVGDVPYAVLQRGSKFVWKDWDKEDGIKYEDLKGNPYDDYPKYLMNKETKDNDYSRGRPFAKSVEHTIVFQPRSDEEKKRVVGIFYKYGKTGSKTSLKNAWDVPDIRSGGKFKDSVQVNMNTQPVGEHEITILTLPKSGMLPEFSQSPVQVTPGMETYLKYEKADWEKSFSHFIYNLNKSLTVRPLIIRRD